METPVLSHLLYVTFITRTMFVDLGVDTMYPAVYIETPVLSHLLYITFITRTMFVDLGVNTMYPAGSYVFFFIMTRKTGSSILTECIAVWSILTCVTKTPSHQSKNKNSPPVYIQKKTKKFVCFFSIFFVS